MGHCFSKAQSDSSDSDQHVDFIGGNVQPVTSKEVWDQKLSEAKRDGKIVIANFSAAWCGPCRMLAPFYCELSEKLPSLMFLLIDVDELTGVLRRCCSWPSGNLENMGHCFSKAQSDSSDSDQHVDFIGGNVQPVTSKEVWDQKLSEAKRDVKIVIANFSAAWCGPCRMLAPFYCELSEKHPSLMFLLIDVDELTELSTSLDIKATPTFFFLKDEQQIDKLVGANKPELQKKITAILDSAATNSEK
ncbi:hypothetical protein REPUB_Repub15cG0147900 [Reevesia pubescens]